jgi:hypothetical protein
LIRWSVDLMQLLKIQIYLIVFCWGSCKYRDDIVILSSIDLETYVWSSSWSLLGHHVMHPLASPSCLTWSFPKPIAWTNILQKTLV